MTRIVTRRKALEAKADEKKEFYIPNDVRGDDDDELLSVMILIKREDTGKDTGAKTN